MHNSITSTATSTLTTSSSIHQQQQQYQQQYKEQRNLALDATAAEVDAAEIYSYHLYQRLCSSLLDEYATLITELREVLNPTSKEGRAGSRLKRDLLVSLCSAAPSSSASKSEEGKGKGKEKGTGESGEEKLSPAVEAAFRHALEQALHEFAFLKIVVAPICPASPWLVGERGREREREAERSPQVNNLIERYRVLWMILY
jgi:hypothetical protein